MPPCPFLLLLTCKGYEATILTYVACLFCNRVHCKRRSSQPVVRSGSSAAELPSDVDQERWESASGSLGADSGSRTSRDRSSSPSVRNAELPAQPEDAAAAKEALCALDGGGMQDALQSAPSAPSSCASGVPAAVDSAEEPAGSWQDDAVEAAAPLGAGEGEARGSSPEVDQRAALPERQPLVQYSVEIVRCRVLCPDWRDTAFAPGTPRETDAKGSRGALLLDVPHALLQMPVQAPAQHPDIHPVQEHCTSRAEDAAGASAAHAAEEKEDEQDLPAPEVSDESRHPHALIFSGRQLGFRVEVFDPGKGPTPLVGAPFLSIPQVSVAGLGPRPLPAEIHLPPGGAWSDSERVPAYEASVASVALVADPGQLEVLRAALEWGQTERAHILGSTEQQAQQGAQPRVSAKVPKDPSGPASACSVTVRLQQVLIRLRGRDAAADPSLMLQARELAAHAASLQQARFAGAAVSLASALVSVAGVPTPDLPPDAQPAAPEPKRPRKALFGRSASAPTSHLKDVPVPRVSILRPWITAAGLPHTSCALRMGQGGRTILLYVCCLLRMAYS